METFSAIESEKALLGAIILDGAQCDAPTVLHISKSELTPEDFTDRNNKTLFSILLRLNDEGAPFWDMVAIQKEAARRGVFNGTDGFAFLGKILSDCFTTTGADYHISEIKKAGGRRSIAAFKAKIADMPLDGFTEKAEAALLGLREKTSKSDGVETFDQIMREALADIEARAAGQVNGIPTGFPSLDKHLGGLQGGDVMVIAARPGVGKSVLLKDIMESAGVPGLVFNLEMSNVETAKRHLSGLSGVDFGKIRTSKLSADDYARIVKAMDQRINIFYSDKANITIDDIMKLSFGLKIKENIGIIGVDYLQLVSARDRNSSREREVSEISRNLKILAKDLKIPIIALSQLNREVEKRKTGKPQLSDLRESGAIEQDSDIVAFLTREGHDAELFIRKARNSEPARVKLFFDGAHQKFRSVTNRELEH